MMFVAEVQKPLGSDNIPSLGESSSSQLQAVLNTPESEAC